MSAYSFLCALFARSRARFNCPRRHGEKWLFPKRRPQQKPLSSLASGAWRLENRYSEQKTGFMCILFI
jgi:hypothetical protein